MVNNKKDTDNIDPVAAYNLRRLRERAGHSQKELAKIYGCTPGLVSNWENGRKPIGNKAREAHARILQIQNRIRPTDVNRLATGLFPHLMDAVHMRLTTL